MEVVAIDSTDPSSFSPDKLTDRYLAKRATDAADSTLRSYRERLERFIEWCEHEGIDEVGDLTPYLVDEYDLHLRSSDNKSVTIKGKLQALSLLLEYGGTIGAVDAETAHSVDIPTLSKGDDISDDRLATEDAKAALNFFRNDISTFGTAMHACLEVTWHVGCRLGGIIGLDVEDFDAANGTLDFGHRPETDTPLKNDEETERLVGISDPVVESLEYYLEREHSRKRDEHGRKPLFSTQQDRPSRSTVRAWCYLATQPCIWTACPHGRRRDRCEYTHRNHASKCPSSRGPHAVRTGSITWQLNSGVDIEDVAERVGSKPNTIRRYYDVADKQERFEERRRNVGNKLDIEKEEE